jgi:uncharacterized protein (DUF58 family)
MRLRGLDWRARALVEGLSRGAHVSRRHGFSVEFSEYRPYVPGDDVRFLDWRVLARTDRDYVRRFEDETNVIGTLVVDASRSMGFGTVGWTKAEYAATLLAGLAAVLDGQGDAVGVQAFAEGLEERLPARHRPGHLRQVLLALDRPPEGGRSDVAAALGALGDRLTRRGLVVVASDLLTPAASLERPLGALRAAGHEVALFVVLDPAELTLSLDGPARLVDLETGEERQVDPAAARPAYLRAIGAHLAAVEAIGARLGVAVVRAPTDRHPGEPLAQYLSARSPRRRR